MSRAPAGSLQSAVLAVLWQAGDWLAAREVHERLQAQRPIGQATVATVLVRLWRKGRLQRSKLGRAFVYRAAETREQFVAERLEAILDVAADRGAAPAQFVEGLSDDERADLARRLGGSER